MMLKDELFEVKECAFMRDFLTDLNDGFPCVFGIGFCAVRTLLIGHYKFALKCLLEDSRGKGFLLDCQFNSDAPGMRFCPDESGVD